jgi:uncharacterized protein YcbK (DUF882 family)
LAVERCGSGPHAVPEQDEAPSFSSRPARILLVQLAAGLLISIPALASASGPPEPAPEPAPPASAPAPEAAAAPAPSETKAAPARPARKKARRRVSSFRGYAPGAALLRKSPPPRPGGELKIFSMNLRETLELSSIYESDGSVDPVAVSLLSRILRDPHHHQVKSIQPRLLELLSMAYEKFGKRQLVLVSGFRVQRGSSNFHTRGAAADIKIEGVSARRLRDYMQSLDSGGMGLGIYPHSGFVHVDVRPLPSYYWTDSSGASGAKRTVRRVRRETVRPELAGAQ